MANLLTTPPKRWIIVEPGITRGGMEELVRRQAENFGLTMDEREWHAEPSPLNRFDSLLAPRLAELERWGIKEVNPTGVLDALKLLRPVRLILTTRDPRAAAASGLRKLDRRRRADQDDEWWRQRLHESARLAIDLRRSWAGDRLRVVRFESLVADESARKDLESWLDWPLDGAPERGLELYNRLDEVAKHGGQLTSKSLTTPPQDSPRISAFADRFHEEAVDYRREFGYD